MFLYCSCLCCHLYMKAYAICMKLICGGFPFVYICLYTRNRVGSISFRCVSELTIDINMSYSVIHWSLIHFRSNLISYVIYTSRHKCWQLKVKFRSLHIFQVENSYAVLWIVERRSNILILWEQDRQVSIAW